MPSSPFHGGGPHHHPSQHAVPVTPHYYYAQRFNCFLGIEARRPSSKPSQRNQEMPHREWSPNPEAISIASLTNDNARINSLINQLELGLPQLQRSHSRLTGPFTNAVLERLRWEFAQIEKALTKMRNRITVSSLTWLLGYAIQEGLAAPSGQHHALDVERIDQLEIEVTEKKKMSKGEM
ncbi:hypothetical protein B0A49_03501 [Cryomyces minteri]|uniref:Uncharacterized protein n=1 Tax=Cryomyces minteri TaxID=331657 RepID=A0A4U0XP86_9PEZI|nr:hypothetical protein B0A49_03501 [Cryomyces minteri]